MYRRQAVASAKARAVLIEASVMNCSVIGIQNARDFELFQNKKITII